MTQQNTAALAVANEVAPVAARIKDNVEKVLVGKGGVIELTLAALFSGGHILIDDVPGIGKTTLARSLASSLDCSFKRIQFTTDLMPSDITGINYYNQKSGDFEFRAGPIIAQVVLADEINRATPRTQSALLEAMAEGQLTVDGTTIPLPSPFLVIATQNPIELEGTFPLPEAQLDRFMLRLRLGYPREEEEEAMLSRFETEDPLSTLSPVAGEADVTGLQQRIREIRFDPVLRNYLVQLVQATRCHADVELGASPRASIGLYRCSQALAAIRGREYVTPDDIKGLAPFALAHRVILRPQARLRERNADSVIEIKSKIPKKKG
jgi:MoxR-like ATPase